MLFLRGTYALLSSWCEEYHLSSGKRLSLMPEYAVPLGSSRADQSSSYAGSEDGGRR